MRDRTADLLNAIQALSQLSYTPIFSSACSLANKRYYNDNSPVCQQLIFKIRIFFHRKKEKEITLDYHLTTMQSRVISQNAWVQSLVNLAFYRFPGVWSCVERLGSKVVHWTHPF